MSRAAKLEAKHSTRRIVVIGGGLWFAIVALIIGIHATDTSPPGSNQPSTNPGLIQLDPCDATVPPQTALHALLESGYTGEISLDETPLPKDEYALTSTDNEIVWPRVVADQRRPTIEPGRHTLSVTYSSEEDPEPRTVTCAFNVG